jgi:hypothetical protein
MFAKSAPEKMKRIKVCDVVSESAVHTGQAKKFVLQRWE